MSKTNGVMSETDLAGLRQRNRERAAAAIERMGTKYVCHRANMLRKDRHAANFTPAAVALVLKKVGVA